MKTFNQFMTEAKKKTKHSAYEAEEVPQVATEVPCTEEKDDEIV